MKRALVFILAVVLVVGMVISVSAADTNASSTETKPFLVSSTSKDCAVHFANEMHELSEEAKEDFEAGLKAVDDLRINTEIIPRYFLYVSTSEKCDLVLWVGDVYGLAAKQFLEGKWVQRKTTMNADETIKVNDVVEGPLLLYVVPTVSPTAPKTSATATAPLPVLISATSDDYALYATTDDYKLTLEARQTFIDAQKSLPEVAPKDMAARYFFYMYTNVPCTAVFEIKNIHEVIFTQYLGGKWTELKSTINADDTVTVENVAEGPMAIFTK